MQKDKTIRVLLLASEFVSARIVLRDLPDSGLEIRQAASLDQFLQELRTAEPDVILLEPGGVDGLGFDEITEMASEYSPAVPIVILGEAGEDGEDAVQYIESGAADYIPLSQIGRLPLVLRRLRRDRDLLVREFDLEADARLAIDGLMENQKLMAVGRLAASIAHEINNPLESITNLLYLMRTDGDVSENSMRYIELAEKEMERVAQISKQTLNFYRETRSPVRVRPFELLEEILVLYSRKIEERRMQVVRQYNTDRTLVVFPGEIRQVLSNLVTNAIEASPMGGKLTLRVHESRMWSDDGVRGLRIVVADNGSGIPEQARQHLGQLFYTTKGQRGTGLGLWVTRAIVRRYGGEIRLYSTTREGRHGTVFSIFLPTNMRPQAVSHEGTTHTDPRDEQRGFRSMVRGEQRAADGSPHGSEALRPREFKRRFKSLAG
jgi:signal transduction histidine kinase